MEKPDENREKNKKHYEKVYANTSINNILIWLKDPKGFLARAIAAETSWNGLYHDDFQSKLAGKQVLEMGCGDCVNAAMMASMGAQVYANDIAERSKILVDKLNKAYKFKYPIIFVEGDFLQNDLQNNQFDIIVGKAFLHHLTIPEERDFLKETSRLLKADGEARFFEPAVNSKFLDQLRWHIPIKGRPSKFDKKAFKVWKENDPHPDRTFSSMHFRKAGHEFFREAEIFPVGSIERFNKFLPTGKFNYKFRRWALANENKLPVFIRTSWARAQLIIYRKPSIE